MDSSSKPTYEQTIETIKSITPHETKQHTKRVLGATVIGHEIQETPKTDLRRETTTQSIKEKPTCLIYILIKLNQTV
jgi:lipid A disaccharide synthetase